MDFSRAWSFPVAYTIGDWARTVQYCDLNKNSLWKLALP